MEHRVRYILAGNDSVYAKCCTAWLTCMVGKITVNFTLISVNWIECHICPQYIFQHSLFHPTGYLSVKHCFGGTFNKYVC